MKITSIRRRPIGAAIGKSWFKEECVVDRINVWSKIWLKISYDLVKFKPYTSLTSLMRGYRQKFTYCMQIIPNISSVISNKYDLITTDFIPAIIVEVLCSINKRKLGSTSKTVWFRHAIFL